VYQVQNLTNWHLAAGHKVINLDPIAGLRRDERMKWNDKKANRGEEALYICSAQINLQLLYSHLHIHHNKNVGV